MRRNALGIGALMLAAGLLSSAPAAADPLKERAQELLSEGNKLVQRGDYVTALTKFRSAHELYPSPKLLINIGTTLRYLGRNAEAAEVYEQYLDDPEAERGQSREVEQVLSEIDDSVGRLHISVAEKQARISVDGRVIADMPKEGIRVDPGRHTVIGDVPGRPATVRYVSVDAEELVRVDLPIADKGDDEAPAEPVDVASVLGYGSIVLGGAAVLVGSALGIASLAARSSADEGCASSGEFVGYCSQAGIDALEQAQALGTGSTVLLVGGFALVATGIIIVLPSESEADAPKVRVATNGAGAVAELTW